ncbi:hypothetical protein CJ030_MR6G003881 [Morella rubra]|uniref:Uncharacterized protein n=1 Tax=Morella rubra TaxID=262757 RepID=A0A6A1VBK8_9ROSI|nr:hypothetical protein CJ030_MR6G003881 [Morella rubra]
MATRNFSPFQTSLFVVLLCTALVVLNSGHAAAEIPPCGTTLYMGLCSEIPDCNQHCLSTLTPCGGFCEPPAPAGSPPACFWLIGKVDFTVMHPLHPQLPSLVLVNRVLEAHTRGDHCLGYLQQLKSKVAAGPDTSCSEFERMTIWSCKEMPDEFCRLGDVLCKLYLSLMLKAMQQRKFHHVGPCSTWGYARKYRTAISIAYPFQAHVVGYASHPLQGPLPLATVKFERRAACNRYFEPVLIEDFSHSS